MGDALAVLVEDTLGERLSLGEGGEEAVGVEVENGEAVGVELEGREGGGFAVGVPKVLSVGRAEALEGVEGRGVGVGVPRIVPLMDSQEDSDTDCVARLLEEGSEEPVMEGEGASVKRALTEAAAGAVGGAVPVRHCVSRGVPDSVGGAVAGAEPAAVTEGTGVGETVEGALCEIVGRAVGVGRVEAMVLGVPPRPLERVAATEAAEVGEEEPRLVREGVAFEEGA